MAVAEHSKTIELQDMDEAIYDDIDTRPAAQERGPLQEQHHVDTTTTAEVAEDGHYDRLNVQQMDDATYEDFRTKTKKKKDLMKTLWAGIRRYKLCAVTVVLLSIAVPLYLHQTNMVERQQLLSSLELSQNIHNLTEQKGQLLSSLEKLETKYDKLEVRYEKLEVRYDKLETTLTEEREQFQTTINDLKRRLCVDSCPSGWMQFGRSCYYRSTEKKTWEESREQCLKTGAHLVIINSKEEQEFIGRLTMLRDETSWIGLKRTGANWTWVETPLTTEYWASGMPGNWQYWDCADYQHNDRKWVNKPCTDGKDNKNNWICEK